MENCLCAMFALRMWHVTIPKWHHETEDMRKKVWPVLILEIFNRFVHLTWDSCTLYPVKFCNRRRSCLVGRRKTKCGRHYWCNFIRFLLLTHTRVYMLYRIVLCAEHGGDLSSSYFSANMTAPYRHHISQRPLNTRAIFLHWTTRIYIIFYWHYRAMHNNNQLFSCRSSPPRHKYCQYTKGHKLDTFLTDLCSCVIIHNYSVFIK